MWKLGEVKLKEDLQKLIFPEGIFYDWENDVFRTNSINLIFYLIACPRSDSEGNKKRDNHPFDNLSLSAEREGFEPPVQLPTLRISSATHSTSSGISPFGRPVGLPGREYRKKLNSFSHHVPLARNYAPFCARNQCLRCLSGDRLPDLRQG